MSAMTDALEVEVRKHLFRTGSYTKPTTLTIRLMTANAGETGGGTEVSGGSYAAQTLNPLDANWTAASATDGLTDNASIITYPAPTASWGTVVGVRLDYDVIGAAFYGSLTQSKTINNGDPAPTFPVGALDVTFA